MIQLLLLLVFTLFVLKVGMETNSLIAGSICNVIFLNYFKLLSGSTMSRCIESFVQNIQWLYLAFHRVVEKNNISCFVFLHQKKNKLLHLLNELFFPKFQMIPILKLSKCFHFSILLHHHRISSSQVLADIH